MESIIPGIPGAKQVVDPNISLQKFSRELKQFRDLETFYRSRGVFLMRATYPEMVFTFWTFKIRPLMCVLAVKLNFTNYNVEPPSVQFVDPLTEVGLTVDELLVRLLRRRLPKAPTGEDTGSKNPVPEIESLVAHHPPGNIPFLCIPGVKEYHDHPFHSNDPWLAHKDRGEGTLGFILDQIVKYGTEPIDSFQPSIARVIPVAPSVLQVHVQGISFNLDMKNIPK